MERTENKSAGTRHRVSKPRKAEDLAAFVARQANISRQAAVVAVDTTLANFHEALTRGEAARGRLTEKGRIILERLLRREFPKAERPAIEKAAFEPDARSRALLLGVKIARQDLRAAGGAYDLAEVESLLGVSRQAINKRVRQGSLLAVPGPGNRLRYPTVQFKPDGSIVEGLREVKEVLPSRNVWVTLNFLVSRDPRLNNRRPIDLLKKGDVESVIESARRIDEQGGCAKNHRFRRPISPLESR
jgi:hypothetical protein